MDFLFLMTCPTGIISPRVDGCARVYIDVGTNLGVQIRKLYEPEYYRGAPVLSLFDKFFGTNRAEDEELCAFGFEPNPVLAHRLKTLQLVYRKRGWRVTIFTNAAAGTHDRSMMPFYSFDTNRIGSSSFVPRTVRGARPNRTTVREIDLGRFLIEVGARKLKAVTSPLLPSFVLMKLDIEGQEIDVLPHLQRLGAIAHVNHTFIELHAKIFRGTTDEERFTKNADAFFDHFKEHPGSSWSELDDESYNRDQLEDGSKVPIALR